MGGRTAHDRGHRQHAYSHAPAAAYPFRSCDHQLSSFSQGTATAPATVAEKISFTLVCALFLQDFIREIAVSPAKRNLLLSGGFDGSVFGSTHFFCPHPQSFFLSDALTLSSLPFISIHHNTVTDISRLCEDITTDQQHSENSIYPCGEVVGSVGWHPTSTSRRPNLPPV
jgi:hypothetical protein